LSRAVGRVANLLLCAMLLLSWCKTLACEVLHAHNES
jgi:hypothetical protein